MQPPFRFDSVPLLPATAAFVAGIIAAYFGWGVIISIVFIAIALGFVIAHKYLYSLWAIMVMLGALNLSIRSDSMTSTSLIGKDCSYTAEITSIQETDYAQIAKIRVRSVCIFPDTSNHDVDLKMLISVPAFSPQLSDGDCIMFRARADSLTFVADLPDQNDPYETFNKENIHLRALVVGDSIVSVWPSRSILANLKRFRNDLLNNLYKSPLSSGTKEFIATALLGKNEISQNNRSAFATAGLSHILALSGLHVSIIATLITLALWPLYFFRKRKAISLITIVILLGYVALTGFGASMTRAVIMTSMYLMARILQRQSSPINSLLLAAMVLLWIDPYYLFAIGFQLSFAAVLSIIIFADALNPISPRRRIPYKIASFVTVSISAMIGTGMISILYFHCLPIYFIITNLFATICLPFLLAGGLISIFFSALGANIRLIFYLTDCLYNALYTFSNFVASLPGSQISSIYVSAWCLVPYSLTLIFFRVWLSERRALWLISFLNSAILTIVVIISTSHREHSPGIYLNSNHYRTDMIVDDGTNILTIISTLPQEEVAILEEAKQNYADYMGLRGIDSIELISQRTFIKPNHTIAKSGDIVITADKTYLLAHGEIDAMIVPAKIDYAVVCRGYRNSMCDLVKDYHPDSIILSYDLHPMRSRKYILECIDSGYNYRVN